MDQDKEQMMALLRSYSTTIDPSSTRSSINLPTAHLGNLPSSQIHGSQIHGSHIHSCPTSINQLDGCSSHTVHGLDHKPNAVLEARSGESTGEQLFWQSDLDIEKDMSNTCRICQVPGEKDDILVSPCRCSGTLKYVHYFCLLKWIDYSSRKTTRAPMCELCHFVYIRHKRFKFQCHGLRWPRVSSRDKCLHTIFLFTLLLMISCAVATVLCFLSDNGQAAESKSQLSTEEIITLTSGVFFFISFFIAMTVEIKARHTLYRLFHKFLLNNTEWQIESYDKTKDVTQT
ncbi:E3 ubiquitin-protein ligase MARCHF9-like [Physella acuta]|uniref:E3 ubiquitin-protein ligase MARCHF9-like n=1 Tax=Physella acuta TaxID=109671 RepID=UPI0027DC7C31|nr:E3 ubiquitin-protein ligase MARCHF9-like [Physella acuta]XP_059145106.1 E3 ubiquitin-protein ligase MARCHF9-like [Physella acuta]